MLKPSRREPLAIFSVVAAAGRPEPSSLVMTDGPAQATLLAATAEHVRVVVTAPGRVVATLAVATSPKWSARLDGRPAALGRTKLGLLQLEVPAGTHTIDIRFRRDGWDAAGTALTAITLVALAVRCYQRRRRPSDVRR